MVNEDTILEKGTDVTELFKELNEQTLTFEFNDKKWVFTYREIHWQDHFNAVERAWKPEIDENGESNLVFDVAQYWETMILKAYLTGPDGGAVTRTTLREYGVGIVGKLISVLPGPMAYTSLANAKKD